jgi:hypothetical protein
MVVEEEIIVVAKGNVTAVGRYAHRVICTQSLRIDRAEFEKRYAAAFGESF